MHQRSMRQKLFTLYAYISAFRKVIALSGRLLHYFYCQLKFQVKICHSIVFDSQLVEKSPAMRSLYTYYGLTILFE